MSAFSKLSRSLGLSADIGLVLLSDRLLAFSGVAPDVIREIPLNYIPSLPPMPPDRLPAEVREGLTTRVHLGEFQSAKPIFVRGEMIVFEAAEDRFKRAIREVTTPKSRFIKPRIVCCIPWSDNDTRKRAMLDALERSGAWSVYLAETGIVTAIGLGLDVLEDQAHGVLVVESDWSVFAVVSYADMLTYRFIPVGSNEISNPCEESAWRELLLDEIASSLAELRPHQTRKLAVSGVCCAGHAQTETWAETIASLIGVSCHTKNTDHNVHPTVQGLKYYVEHLDQWKKTIKR